LLILSTVLFACAGPFFPVPPPEDATFTTEALTDSSGQTRMMWRAHRGPDARAADAQFFVEDATLKTEVSSFADADGTYVSPLFEGQTGDRMNLSFQQASGDKSQSACLILQEGSPKLCPP